MKGNGIVSKKEFKGHLQADEKVQLNRCAQRQRHEADSKMR